MSPVGGNPMAAQSAEESKRMKVLHAILQKALDTSIQKASLIDMASPDLEANGLQVIQSIRHRIEAQFNLLCEQYDLNSKFVQLETLIEWQEKSQLVEEVGLTTPLDANATAITPQEVLQKERIRFMLQEKARLAQQLQQLQKMNAGLEASVQESRNKGQKMLLDIDARLDPLGPV
ncbi:hypothetical protein LEN26_019154 [Aphanomyces euteiches]|nr:hypothetical protein LEN26_019154 [Aphanomyces euteiches]KAH9105916.1 hypothetical protein AeMF1_018420 [Aphanomyces euteiches]KAH9194006.1 hypothetical protein AeNC1_004031 [Aphanomyces euteiches]